MNGSSDLKQPNSLGKPEGVKLGVVLREPARPGSLTEPEFLRIRLMIDFKGRSVKNGRHSDLCPLAPRLSTERPEPGRNDGRARSPIEHSKIYCWVQTITPIRETGFRRAAKTRSVGKNWRTEETLIKIEGQ